MGVVVYTIILEFGRCRQKITLSDTVNLRLVGVIKDSVFKDNLDSTTLIHTYNFFEF